MPQISSQAQTTSTAPTNPSTNQSLQINIGWIESLIFVIVFLVGLGISWGTLKSSIGNIKDTLDKEIKPDLKATRDKVNILWADKYAPASSPRQLNDMGNTVLNESGIKQIVDEKKDELLDLVKQRVPKNAYDAEREIQMVMTSMPEHHPEVVDRLKEGAFKTGVDINTVLFIGSIYLRNLIFESLGFNLTDLDA